MIKGPRDVSDQTYWDTRDWVIQIILNNRPDTIVRPSLAPWRFSYAAARPDPARYNLPPFHQRRALDSDTSEVYPVGPCGLSLAHVHQRGSTRLRGRVRPSLDYTCMEGMRLPRDHPQPPPPPPPPQVPQQPPEQMPQPLQQMLVPPQQTSQQLTSQLHGWASGQQSPAPEPEHKHPRRSKARAPAPTTASAPPAASQHAPSAPAACAPSAEPPIAEQAAALPPPESAHRNRRHHGQRRNKHQVRHRLQLRAKTWWC